MSTRKYTFYARPKPDAKVRFPIQVNAKSKAKALKHARRSAKEKGWTLEEEQ